MAEGNVFNSAQGLQWKRVHYGEARLESTRRSSIILAAFTFSIFSSLQLNFPSECPWYLVTALAVNSALLISMHSFSFIISTCILPKLQAVAQEYHAPSQSNESLDNVPAFSPHDKFHGVLELAYNISHILGLFLFLLEIPLVAWVKFWDESLNACYASSIAVLPFMVGFALFCWQFNHVLSTHAYDTRSHLLEDVATKFHSDEALIIANMNIALPKGMSSSWSDVSMSPRGMV